MKSYNYQICGNINETFLKLLFIEFNKYYMSYEFDKELWPDRSDFNNTCFIHTVFDIKSDDENLITISDIDKEFFKQLTAPFYKPNNTRRGKSVSFISNNSKPLKNPGSLMIFYYGTSDTLHLLHFIGFDYTIDQLNTFINEFSKSNTISDTPFATVIPDKSVIMIKHSQFHLYKSIVSDIDNGYEYFNTEYYGDITSTKGIKTKILQYCTCIPEYLMLGKSNENVINRIPIKKIILNNVNILFPKNIDNDIDVLCLDCSKSAKGIYKTKTYFIGGYNSIEYTEKVYIN